MDENEMKFDMFEGIKDFDFNLLEEGETSEVVSVTLKSDTKKKYSTVKVRSQEEYETYIDSHYFETHYMQDGTPYEVKVTVLKPEVNMLEQLRPAYAYATSH